MLPRESIFSVSNTTETATVCFIVDLREKESTAISQRVLYIQKIRVDNHNRCTALRASTNLGNCFVVAVLV